MSIVLNVQRLTEERNSLKDLIEEMRCTQTLSSGEYYRRHCDVSVLSLPQLKLCRSDCVTGGVAAAGGLPGETDDDTSDVDFISLPPHIRSASLTSLCDF